MKNQTKKIFSYLVAISIFFIFISNVYSQFTDDFVCGDSDIVVSGSIPVHTPETGKFFRVLIIYITFPDDATTGTSTNIWPIPSGNPLQPSKPINPYQTDGRMIDTSEHSSSISFMSRYGEYTYSDFFCEMSMGDFDFIGDEVKVLLPNPSTYYDNNNTRHGALNLIALQKADSQGVNFSRYDNWNNSNGSYGSDDVVDFVIYHYRYVPGNNYSWFYGDPGVGGSTEPGVYTTLQGKAFNKGAWGIGSLFNTTRTQLVIEHEFVHFIQYFNHPGRNYGHVSMGLETAGHGQSTYCMIPMERCGSALNWDTATFVDENNVLSSYTLGDYISTGDVLQIKIPNTNPVEYFWLSNNQKVSKYDGVSRGSNTCWQTNKYQQDPYCGTGKGFFIFYESATNCSNNINGYDPGYGNVYFPFDLMNAEGKFDWALDRRVTDPFLGTFGIQKVTNGDRVNGVSEFNKLYLRAYPNWSGQLITDDPCSSDTSDYFITGDFHGDGLDSYNINYDEIFSPYSNPATNSCQNPSTNSGLTIALQSQDSATGAITVKVYFDDATAITDLPPSKPKNISVTKNYTSGNGNPFNPKITWDGNIEPDFYDASPST